MEELVSHHVAETRAWLSKQLLHISLQLGLIILHDDEDAADHGDNDDCGKEQKSKPLHQGRPPAQRGKAMPLGICKSDTNQVLLLLPLFSPQIIQRIRRMVRTLTSVTGRSRSGRGPSSF